MDQTMEDLKFIGFSGIFSHSSKTIFTNKKLFTQITLTLILPLTLIFIAHMQISLQFFNNIETSPYQLFVGAFDSYQSYYDTEATTDNWRSYFLFKSVTIAIITVISLLSTASIVYTVASVYTGRDVTYSKSMKVVPKVWKRLIVTLLCMFLSLFAYSLITSVANFMFSAVFQPTEIAIGGLLSFIFVVVYVFGFLYMSLVWQLASVVSVLESLYGIRGMIKAIDLMKGKRKTALMVSCVLYQFLVGVVHVIYMPFVADNYGGVAPVWRVMIAILCGVLLVFIFLLFIVTETVIYLVCKLHHGETVDPVSLSTFLSAYLSDSRPVFRTGEDIQLGRPQNQLVSQV